VKELSALLEAGYRVHVVACKFLQWANKADTKIATADCSWSWVRFGPLANRPAWFWQQLRHKGARFVARPIVDILSLPRLYHDALHPASSNLVAAARKIPAKLYIAHNLAALPAAVEAARLHGGRCGFDAEDFHRGEFAETSYPFLQQRLVERLEQHFIPRCAYVTAASDGIGAAYADALDIPRPVTILNVFPKSDAEYPLDKTHRVQEKPNGITSVYWFSQTIGPGRGLEDMVRALGELPVSHCLSIRGQWSAGFRETLMNLAGDHNVADQIRHLPPAPPEEMIARAACHDIGLASEQATCLNRDICVTNKIFTYLLARIPSVVTNTRGQTAIARRFPDVTRIVQIGDHAGLSDAIQQLHAQRPEQDAALRKAANALCWDREKDRFLTIVREQLERPVDSRRWLRGRNLFDLLAERTTRRLTDHGSIASKVAGASFANSSREAHKK